MTKNERPEDHVNDRRSRFEWRSSDIVVIKNPDQETKGKSTPAAPEKSYPAEPKPKKDCSEVH